jgi:hypothetical protein
LAPLIFGFTGFAVFAEDARQLTCSGTMIEPSAMSPSPQTVVLTLGPAQKVTLDLGKGMVNARKVSDNKIQLKFRTKDQGEYVHYDLFFIYKSGDKMEAWSGPGGTDARRTTARADLSSRRRTLHVSVCKRSGARWILRGRPR